MNLKVLSWNIWVNNHFTVVKDFIQKFDADILGLQEVSANDESRDLVSYMSELGYQNVFFPQPRSWSPNGRKDGPAIFSKHEIVSSEKYLLSEKFGVGAVQADIKISDKIIHFFSTHLSHTHQKDTVDQMGQLQKILPKIPTQSSILMGDFNAIPTSQTIQEVKKHLIDTDPGNQPTWSVYPEGCPVCNPLDINIRLDYIFTTSDITSHSYKVQNSKGSDHLPISLVIDH